MVGGKDMISMPHWRPHFAPISFGAGVVLGGGAYAFLQMTLIHVKWMRVLDKLRRLQREEAQRTHAKAEVKSDG
jgi:hypothetical protein